MTVIEPPRAWRFVDLGELWQYGELLGFLVWRDVRVRYKQQVLGIAWSVLQPVLTMAVFSIVVGKLMGLDQRLKGVTELPYPIYVYAGLLPWNLFSGGLAGASNSLLASSSVITKIYFPRLLVPLASVGVNLVNFVISLVVLLAMMAWYGVVPGMQIVLLPLLVALILLASLSFGVGLSALTVRYRDFTHIVPFFVQTLFYLTPVIYPVTIVPEQYRWAMALNPMTGLVSAFRWCLTGSGLEIESLAIGAGLCAIALVASLVIFRRVEAEFADIV